MVCVGVHARCPFIHSFMPFHPSRYEGWTERFNSHEAQLEYVIEIPKVAAVEVSDATAVLTVDFQRAGVHTCRIDLSTETSSLTASL